MHSGLTLMKLILLIAQNQIGFYLIWFQEMDIWTSLTLGK